MATSTGFAGPWTSLPLDLTPWILDVILEMGHTRMTPVQASTIPLFMKHKDVVVEAVTGSGKTLAFVIPIIELLSRRNHKLRKNEIGALVISPTRELATQIYSIFSTFLASGEDVESGDIEDRPSALLLVSSPESSPAEDIKRFLSSGADIVVGTPGRIEEFLLGKGRDVVSVKEMDVLVLDEADRLLDLGFQTSITRILTHLPKQRRTGLFSATMTDGLSELVRVGLRNPARVVVKVQAKTNILSADGKNSTQLVEERRIPANLRNYYLVVKASEKLVQLLKVISHETSSSQASHFIIYLSTGACVDYFYKILRTLLPESASLYSLHGQLPASVRTRTLAAFSSAVSLPSAPCLLLATDVAARGLDLPHVDVVIQFDPPTDTKAFSHRCGRTARAGRSGTAWVLLVGREVDYVDLLSVRKIPVKTHPDFLHLEDGDRAEDPLVEENLTKIRHCIMTDRALNELAVRAFVSSVQAYSKHEASYIFRLKDFDLVGLAKCFGLLRLPKMPELKGVNIDRWEDAKVDWSKYAFADKLQEAKRAAKEKERVSNVQVEQRESKRRPKNLNISWSEQASKKEEKEKRREKNKRKQAWVKTQTQDATGRTKRTYGEDADDWKELAKEERMAKKVRRGEVSQSAFDVEFGGLE